MRTTNNDVYDPFATKPRVSLPERLRTSTGRWMLVGILLLLALLGAAVYGWYEANHQPLFIVNGLDQPVRVSIDGGDKTTIAAKSHLEITIPEGDHQAVAKGENGLDETIDFAVKNSLAQRYFGNSVFVLNVAKAGTVLYQQITYSKNPGPLDGPRCQLYYDQHFFVFRDIDYPFCEPPEKLHVDTDSDVMRSHLTMFDGEPWQALLYFNEGTPPQEMLSYFEHKLAFHPNDEELLALYASLAESQKLGDRSRAYLEEGLQRRPVAVEWHRMYQEMQERRGQDDALTARYDAMLKASPNDSMLLYLRGRITRDSKEADTFFDKATEKDPENAYAYSAKAYRLFSHGRFAEAQPLAAKAHELNPSSIGTAGLFFEIQLALRHFDALDEALAASDGGLVELFGRKDRMRAFVAKGDVHGARACHEQFVQGLGPAGAGSRTALHNRYALEYLLGEMEQAAVTAEQIHGLGEDHDVLWATRLEQGRPKEAVALVEGFPDDPSGTQALLISLAWTEAGDDAAAKRWQEKAIELLAKGSVDERRAGTLLDSEDGVTIDEVNNLVGERAELVVILTALADTCPQLREELVARAEKLNTLDTFPHRFLKRILDKM